MRVSPDTTRDTTARPWCPVYAARVRDLPSRFWAPADLTELRAAIDAVDCAGLPLVVDAWGWGGDDAAPAAIELPRARPHPAALTLLARAAGVQPAVLGALVAGEVWVDDAGAPALWPCYPEEDAQWRPAAEVEARRLGVDLPARHLDEPFDPAWYLARTGPDALGRWLAGRGVDAGGIEVRTIVAPPRRRLRPVRHEGGWRGPSVVAQALSRLAWGPIVDEVDLDRRLRQVCAGLGGEVVEPPPSPAWEDLSLAPGDGRLDGLRAEPGGVVVRCGDRAVLVAAGGAVGPAPAFPSPGHGPTSPCGRFTWAGTAVERLADGVQVGELPDAPPPRGPVVLPPPDAPTTVLGGVRFTIRRASGRVAPGPGAAFALGADGRWRWVQGGVLGVGRRSVARLGSPAHHAAFSPDGAALWVLTDDVLAHLVDDGGWRLVRSWPVAEVSP